ncbi:MAG: PQQ-binding-like beta-propeller repeat protein [Candidatus Thermoplasmatota archaeon]|nr:PQQ-binding-like beta-propeller repeat protein [Candidatus Thermoplasmatota archaeon]
MKWITLLIIAVILMPTFAYALPNDPPNFSSDYIPTVSENAASYGKGYRYNVQGLIYVHIEGDAYERGYQHGYILYPEIMDMMYRWSNIIHNCPIVIKYIPINQTSPRYEKISSIWWNYCRNKAMNIFWDYYPPEYKAEIKGIADAVSSRGGKMFGEAVSYEDVLTLNEMYELMSILVNPHKNIHPLRTLFYDLLGVAPELENKENEFIFSIISSPPVHHCNGFIATGDATTNGQVVATDSVWCGGWWYTYYIAQRWNVILDIVPSQGNRIIMGTSPGYIWSDEDYYQNDKGIIFIETTCPQGLWKKGLPLAVRARSALQYGESIDNVIKYMRTDNNGVMNAVWLIGDTKNGEIARLELGLYESAVWRTKNGFYWSANNPMDPSVRREQLRFGSIKGAMFRVISMLFNTSGYEYYTLRYYPSDRDIKFEKFGNENYGKIDVDAVKNLMSNPPISEFSTDCKLTDSYLLSQNAMWAFWGNPHGELWNTSSLKSNLRGVADVPPAGWVCLYGIPSTSPEFIYQPSLSKGEKAEVLWEYNMEGTNFEVASGTGNEDAVYMAASSGKLYAFDSKSGNLLWNRVMGEKVSTPSYCKGKVFVGTDRGLYALNTHGDVEWSYEADISSQPVIYGDSVIAGCEDGNVYCLSSDNGKKIWSVKLNGTSYPSDVVDGKVYVASGKKCCCINAKNGKTLWTFESGGVITSRPNVEDKTVYFGSWDCNLYALDAGNGDLKWKYTAGWGIDTTPAADGNHIFFGSMDNNFYALDAKNGKLDWVFTCKAAIHSSPKIYGEHVFFGADDGSLYAINRTNGGIAWSFSPLYSMERNVYNYIATPMLSNPCINSGNVFVGAGGHIYALDSQTEEVFLSGRHDSKSPTSAFIAIPIGIIIILFVIIYIYYIKNHEKK